MVDKFDKKIRSRMMSGIRGKDTKPEMQVRRYLHAVGLRYALHRRDLPGCPDIVLPRLKAIVQVHGCFWHGHPGCRFATIPQTRKDFWIEKITANRARDGLSTSQLLEIGWRVAVVWECALKMDAISTLERLEDFIRSQRSFEEFPPFSAP